MHRLCRYAIWVLLLTTPAGLRAAGFEAWDTENPVRVARTSSSTFDVHASTISPDRIYATYWTYTPSAGHAVAAFRLQRTGRGFIKPLANPASTTENREWEWYCAQVSTNPQFFKSVDVWSEDTGTVRLLLSGEQGRADHDGSIEVLLITNGTPPAISLTLWKDLTDEHPAGLHAFQPCGVAVDPARQRVLVPTDIMNGTNGFRVYGYDADALEVTGSVYAVGDLVTSGGTNTFWDGPRAIALADHTFLIGGVGAPLTNQGVWKIDPSAHTATQILFRADIEEPPLPGALADAANPVQDLLVHNGYLYLAQYSGRILAFEWDEERQTVKDRVADGLLNLTELYRTRFGHAGANASGLSVTSRGELLVSSMSDNTTPMVVAFNLTPHRTPLLLRIR